MKKVIRLTESDLTRIVKRVIKENDFEKYGYNDEESFLEDYENADEHAFDLIMEMDHEITELISDIFSYSNLEEKLYDIVNEYQNRFKEDYEQFADNEDELNNENIDNLMKINPSKLNLEDLAGQTSGYILDDLYKTGR